MKKLQKRAVDILNQIEKNKKLYEELEEITEALRKKHFKSDSNLVLVDNFRQKNSVFRTTSVKRFELKRI